MGAMVYLIMGAMVVAWNICICSKLMHYALYNAQAKVLTIHIHLILLSSSISAAVSANPKISRSSFEYSGAFDASEPVPVAIMAPR